MTDLRKNIVAVAKAEEQMRLWVMALQKEGRFDEEENAAFDAWDATYKALQKLKELEGFSEGR